MYGGIDLRKHESIAIDPIGILRIEGHELVEQYVGSWSKAHWSSGVTGVCLERRIDLDDS